MVAVASLRLTRAFFLALTLVLAIALGAQTVRAQDVADPSAETPPDAAPPPDAVARPFFVSLGVGTGVRLDGFVGAGFRIVEEVGLHLEGTPVGPFFAITLAEDIAGYYSMQMGVRVGWDLEILRRDFSIVVSPSIGIAYAFDVVNGADYSYFLVQPALGLAVLLLDRVLAIWLRPIGVDIYIGEATHGGWAFAAGATIAF